MAAPDLITQAALTAAIGDLFTAADIAKFPSLTVSASRAVRVYCNRYFTRRPAIDELYTVRPRGSIVLREYPVNGVSRVASSPTPVLSISNTDTATNQRATVTLATSGSVDLGLVTTGVTLNRWASGVQVAASVPFNTSLTIQAVATAVNALGGGWLATVGSGYGLWPSADLRGVQAAQPGMNISAVLMIHTSDMAFVLDEVSGIIDLVTSSGGSSFGGSGLAFDDLDGSGLDGTPQGVRVVYDAGFDTIPEDVQQATIEVVQAELVRLRQMATGLKSETIRNYSWTGIDRLPAIPESAMDILNLWRNVRG